MDDQDSGEISSDDQNSGEISSEEQIPSQIPNGITKRENQTFSEYACDWPTYLRTLNPEQLESIVPAINAFLDGEVSRAEKQQTLIERKYTLDSGRADDFYKKLLSLILIIIAAGIFYRHPEQELAIGCLLAGVGLSHTFKIPLGDLANILNRIISKE